MDSLGDEGVGGTSAADSGDEFAVFDCVFSVAILYRVLRSASVLECDRRISLASSWVELPSRLGFTCGADAGGHVELLGFSDRSK